MDESLRRSLRWLTAIRVVVFFLILLSAILVQAGSAPASLLPDARPRTSTSPTSTGCARRPSSCPSSTGRSGDSCRRALGGVPPDPRRPRPGLHARLLLGRRRRPSSRSSTSSSSAPRRSCSTGPERSSSRRRRPRPRAHGRADRLRDPAPPPHGLVVVWGPERIGYNLAITIIGFYGVAFMVSYLSEKLRGTREELEQPAEGALARSRTSTPTSSRRCRRGSSPPTRASASRSSTRPAERSSASFRRAPRAGCCRRSAWTCRAVGRDPPPDAGPRRLPRRARDPVRGVEARHRLLRARPERPGLRGGRRAAFVFQDLTEVKKLERQARFKEQLAAVGELAAGIAHEIRNPLASISGSVQVLSNELSVGSAERRLMEIIVSESNRLSKILKGFLRFVRPQETARRRLRHRPGASARTSSCSVSPTRSRTRTRSRSTSTRPVAARGGPGPDPADRLQRREERGARDARRRDADRRGPRGRRLV